METRAEQVMERCDEESEMVLSLPFTRLGPMAQRNSNWHTIGTQSLF
jgi:hypothetical protein